MNWAPGEIQQHLKCSPKQCCIGLDGDSTPWTFQAASGIQQDFHAAPTSSLTNPPTSQASRLSTHIFSPLLSWGHRGLISSTELHVYRCRAPEERLKGSLWGSRGKSLRKDGLYKSLVAHHREIFAFPVFPAPPATSYFPVQTCCYN